HQLAAGEQPARGAVRPDDPILHLLRDALFADLAEVGAHRFTIARIGRLHDRAEAGGLRGIDAQVAIEARGPGPGARGQVPFPKTDAARVLRDAEPGLGARQVLQRLALALVGLVETDQGLAQQA